MHFLQTDTKSSFGAGIIEERRVKRKLGGGLIAFPQIHISTDVHVVFWMTKVQSMQSRKIPESHTVDKRIPPEYYFKGLVSHQEFAGSNSCWRPFFGTNRLDDE